MEINNNKEEIDNIGSQKDEIEALESIYSNDFVLEDEFSPTISIVIRTSDVDAEKNEATLVVSFNSNYPSRSPPVFYLSVPWIKREQKQTLDNLLQDIYLEHMGENIVYIWVEKLRELLSENWNLSENSPPNHLDSRILEKSLISSPVPNLLLPEIFTGEPITDRKSTFQAHVAKINHVEQVRLVLDELRKNKKIATAAHNMYAYRVFNEESKLWQNDCDDDGETHAGGRLLHLLNILSCSNVIVVVTRWYGGIMLHADRFKHISNVARLQLQGHGFLQSINVKKQNSASKP